MKLVLLHMIDLPLDYDAMGSFLRLQLVEVDDIRRATKDSLNCWIRAIVLFWRDW